MKEVQLILTRISNDTYDCTPSPVPEPYVIPKFINNGYIILLYKLLDTTPRRKSTL